MPNSCHTLLSARWAGAKAVSLYPQSVYAPIAENQDAIDSKSIEKHDLIIRFLRGARRLNPGTLLGSPLGPDGLEAGVLLASAISRD